MPESTTTLISSIRLRGDGDGPRLLITAGVHGDEYEPMQAVRVLAQQLKSKMIRGELTLVPLVNQPAFERASRVADDGIDLARTCPGRADGTITERIAAELSPMIQNADFYIDLHTGGTHLRLTPLSGYVLHQNRKTLDAQRAMAAAFGLPLAWGTSPNLQGRSLSVARDANVPAIYCEFGGGTVFQPQIVDAYVQGCLNVMASFGMIDASPRAATQVRTIEDHREDSGHLQRQCISPTSGFLIDRVELGSEVREGQAIADVVAADGTVAGSIESPSSGILVMLRTTRRVAATDPVAAIASNSGGAA